MPASGSLAEVGRLIRRVVARNPSPFTATGTCSYIIGRDSVAILDPGPDDDVHLDALLRATAGERVAAILVTHTHRDHSPGARALRDRTGAPIVGCGPHRTSRPVTGHEAAALEASVDHAHASDRVLADGEALHGDGWTLTAVATPGHTMNHLAFALAEEPALFSGDHVMAWSTSVVAPPDGSMRAYMDSLDAMRDRPEPVFWPGHGGPVRDPRRFVRGLAAHRRQRESAIRARIEAGDHDIETLVARIYQGLHPRLRKAAALSVLAHLEDMVERGLVTTDRPLALDGRFFR